MNADDFRDYMLSFLFLRYLSDNYQAAAKKELGPDYPQLAADDRRPPLSVWYADNAADVPISLFYTRERRREAERAGKTGKELPEVIGNRNALLMKEGAQDFRSGQKFDHTVFFGENVDIHHIFPQDWCKKHGIKPAVYDSIINKTPLSYRTNRIIGGVAPSEYLAKSPVGASASRFGRADGGR